jgi:ATP-binding cassette, subfamily B, bacterial
LSNFANKTKRATGIDKPALPHVLRCLAYFREDLPLIILLLVLTGCSSFLGLLQAWPLAILVDSALGSQAHENWLHKLLLALLPEDAIKRILGLALIALLLRLTMELISMARRLLAHRIHYIGLLRVRCDLYRKLQAMHLDYHRSQPMADSLFRLTTDTLGCQAVLIVITNLLFAVMTLGVIVALLIERNLPLTLIALSIAPPLIGVNVLFGRRLAQRSRKSKEYENVFTTSIQRSMSAIVLTQIFGREEEEFSRFGTTARKCIRAWFAIHRQEIGYNLSVGLMLGLWASMLLGYGGILLHQRQLTPGELMIFMTYLGLLYDPLCQITGLGFNLQTGLAGARRVFEVLDRDIKVADRPGAVSLNLKPRRLELEHVGFEYSSGRPVLREISVRIEPGESLAFIGSSGVGKSTLLNLLPRFYDPTAGIIKLDGWDLRLVRLRDTRRHITVVLQESVILPTSIAENIAYGCPEATLQQIREAARLAGASGFIEGLPEGYQTQLSDAGLNLSGGQRQRIALARALLTKAPILVLDEPTSALDTDHERIVIETLTSLRGKRTVLLVSHRISAVMNCDRICVLANGTIVEQGSHSELIKRGGIYAAIANQQLHPVFQDTPPPLPIRSFPVLPHDEPPCDGPEAASDPPCQCTRLRISTNVAS